MQKPGMFSYVSVKDRVSKGHPSRTLRVSVETVPKEVDAPPGSRYATAGCNQFSPSLPTRPVPEARPRRPRTGRRKMPGCLARRASPIGGKEWALIECGSGHAEPFRGSVPMPATRGRRNARRRTPRTGPLSRADRATRACRLRPALRCGDLPARTRAGRTSGSGRRSRFSARREARSPGGPGR